MNTSTNTNESNTASSGNTHPIGPGEIRDGHIRASVHVAEERLVRTLRGLLKPTFKATFGEVLHLEMPDESYETWVLAFQRLAGKWRFVIHEENSLLPARHVVTVAPTMPLAEAGLAPLLFFSPYLEAFAQQILREARHAAKRARKRGKGR